MKTIIYSIFLCFTITTVAQSNLEEFLVLNIPFNGEAIDETGNLDFPILVFGATLCNDKYQSPNSAYKFDGIDDYIVIPHDQILNFNSSYSVSFWVKLSSDIIGEQERIIGKGLSHTGEIQNWSFTFKDDQKMDFFGSP